MIQSVVGKFVEKGRWIREEEREREFSSRKREIFTTLSNRSKGENIGGKSFFFSSQTAVTLTSPFVVMVTESEYSHR